MVNVASVNKLRLFSTDVNQTYIHRKEDLQREMFVKPCKEFGLEDGKFLKLKQLSNGLAEFQDYWCRTLSKHSIEDLNMTQSTLDPTVYCKHNFEDFIGV